MAESNHRSCKCGAVYSRTESMAPSRHISRRNVTIRKAMHSAYPLSSLSSSSKVANRTPNSAASQVLFAESKIETPAARA
jgi:hypothetical protein